MTTSFFFSTQSEPIPSRERSRHEGWPPRTNRSHAGARLNRFADELHPCSGGRPPSAAPLRRHAAIARALPRRMRASSPVPLPSSAELHDARPCFLERRVNGDRRRNRRSRISSRTRQNTSMRSRLSVMRWEAQPDGSRTMLDLNPTTRTASGECLAGTDGCRSPARSFPLVSSLADR